METLDAVTDDREEVVITRPGKDDVIMVSRSDYESLRESAFLLRGPANARRIVASTEELEAGRGAARKLSEGGLSGPRHPGKPMSGGSRSVSVPLRRLNFRLKRLKRKACRYLRDLAMSWPGQLNVLNDPT